MGLVSSKKPDIVFFMKTKVGCAYVEQLHVKLGFDWVFCVKPVGLSGGLAVIWLCSNMVSLLSYSKNHIDLAIALPGAHALQLMGYYSFPKRSRHATFLGPLRLGLLFYGRLLRTLMISHQR